jgi:hypothetical protein
MLKHLRPVLNEAYVALRTDAAHLPLWGFFLYPETSDERFTRDPHRVEHRNPRTGRRLSDERDRRYTEVNIEKEKALQDQGDGRPRSTGSSRVSCRRIRSC